MRTRTIVILTILCPIVILFSGLYAHALYWDRAVTGWMADPANGKDDEIVHYITEEWCRPWFRPISESRQAELVTAAVKNLAIAPEAAAATEAQFVFLAIGLEWKRDGSYRTFPTEVNDAVQAYGGRNILSRYSALLDNDIRQYLDIPGAIKSSRATHDVVALMGVLDTSDFVENMSLLQELLNDPIASPIAKRSVLRRLQTRDMLETSINQPLWEKLRAEMGSYADEFVETMEKK